MLKRTHRLIMIQFQTQRQVMMQKLILDRLKRTTFMDFQPFYDSQVRHFIGKVTERNLVIDPQFIST